MRAWAVVGGALVGAVAIGVVFAMTPWLVAGHVPTVDETLADPEIAMTGGLDVAPSMCAYCRPLDELRSAFVRRAEAAQHRVAVLKDSLESREAAGDDDAIAASADVPLTALQDDLSSGERNLAAAMAAVERIDGWRKRCQDDPICRPSQTASVVSMSLQDRCTALNAPTLSLAEEARKIGQSVIAVGADCEGKTCPAADCTKTRDLRQALAEMASALDVLAGGTNAASSRDLTEVRRSAEMRDVAEKTSDEIRYASRLFPMMFNDSAETSASDVLEMADKRLTTRAAILATMMKRDLPKAPAETELAWRLKLIGLDVASLRAWAASSVAGLRREDGMVEHWGELSDDLGGALMHAAKLDLALQRRTEKPKGTDCKGSQETANAAAAVKAALSAIALCTRRGGCDADEPLVNAPIDSAAAAELLQTSVAAARTAASNLAVTESEAPNLSLANQSYAPGEAIAIRMDTSRSQCLRGASALLQVSTPKAKTPALVTPLNAGETAYIAAPEYAGSYDITLAAPASRGGVALASAEFSVGAAPVGCSGFEGRWKTDFGDLNLKVRDQNVSGTYRRASDNTSGVIVGVVAGTVMRGQWASQDGTGGLRLTLDEATRAFSGTWSRTTDAIAGEGTWSGQCAPSPYAEAPRIEPY